MGEVEEILNAHRAVRLLGELTQRADKASRQAAQADEAAQMDDAASDLVAALESLADMLREVEAVDKLNRAAWKRVEAHHAALKLAELMLAEMAGQGRAAAEALAEAEIRLAINGDEDIASVLCYNQEQMRFHTARAVVLELQRNVAQHRVDRDLTDARYLLIEKREGEMLKTLAQRTTDALALGETLQAALEKMAE